MEVWMRSMWMFAFVATGAMMVPGLVRADREQLAPGTGRQDSVVINTGADGLCDTSALKDDIQLTEVGSGAGYANAVRCGPDQTADSQAAGDDTQLIQVGASCQNPNSTAVDTGPNGIVETMRVGDDTYVNGLTFGGSVPNSPCILTGANGIADTSPPGGDDQVELLVGQAEPNTAVARCGPNLVAETTANNVDAGDDVQLVPVGQPCNNGSEIVVDSGPDGVSATRAEGVDLRLETVKPVKLTIKKKKREATKKIVLQIRNVEFGDQAPSSRAFRIDATRGNCARDVFVEVDADAKASGVQTMATVPRKGRAKASVTVRARLEGVTTSDAKNPERCAFNIDVVALDTDPELDDGANTRANRAVVEMNIVDKNDL